MPAKTRLKHTVNRIYGYIHRRWLIAVMMIAATVMMCSPKILRAQDMADTATLMREVRAGQQAGKNFTRQQQRLKDIIGQQAQSQMLKSAYADRTLPTDSAAQRLIVSVLTCGPGNEIYEYYGHSAIRIQRKSGRLANPEQENTYTDAQISQLPAAQDSSFDVVFNYGVFDFNSGNFVLRFALGHTDYICAMEETDAFLEQYRRRGSYVDEQVLNLTQNEANYLLQSLLVNAQPQNRVYRYNFLYDNCATRVRDKIEEAVNGTLKYPERPVSRTWRDAIHFYSHYYQWSTFAQDLVLGSDADEAATGRELEFAPLIMEQDFATTLIQARDGIIYPLVKDSHRIVDLPPLKRATAFPLSPLCVSIILVAGALIIGVAEWKKRKIYWGIDTAIIVLQSVAGCIVAFLFFFSTHPAVGSNWLVWVFNPLPLLGLYWQINGARHHRYYAYHVVAAPILAAFLLALPWIPQHVDAAAILLVVFLLIRSLTSLCVWLRIKKDIRKIKKNIR